MKTFDLVPFFNEIDLLEIRLHELKDVVDHFLIFDARETYGGHPREPISFDRIYPILPDELKITDGNRFYHVTFEKLHPECINRETGRLREAYQRNCIFDIIKGLKLDDNDIIIFSDLDEIPRASKIQEYKDKKMNGIYRFKQNQYYYNVNTLTDYGHDWGSRARIGRYSDLVKIGNLYDFRMAHKNTEKFVIEDGGWHFSYFGGVESIHEKVAALSPFLSEYKLFGDKELQKDIEEGKDLHRRRNCELPSKFEIIPISSDLPNYFLENLGKFNHFIRNEFK